MPNEKPMPIQSRKLDSSAPDFVRQLNAVLAFESEQDEAIDRAAAEILAQVKARGDEAVLEYTHRFARVAANSVAALEIGAGELQSALAQLPPASRAALQTAADRVRSYH